MKLERSDAVFAVLLLLLLVANALVAVNLFQQRGEASEALPGIPVRAATTTVPPVADGRAITETTAPSSTASRPQAAGSAVERAAAVALQQQLSGGLQAAQALSVSDGSLAITASDLQSAFAGVTFHDGATPPAGAVGVVSAADSIVLLGQTDGGRWYCAGLADGQTVYGESDERADVASMEGCSASATGWGG